MDPVVALGLAFAVVCPAATIGAVMVLTRPWGAGRRAVREYRNRPAVYRKVNPRASEFDDHGRPY